MSPLAALLLLLCILGARADSLPAPAGITAADSLLDRVLYTANLRPSDLSLALLPPGRDSLRLAIVDQVLAGRRADLWVDSLAHELESAPGLAALGRALNRASAPLYGAADQRLLPAPPGTGEGGRAARRQWIHWFRQLAGLRFLPDSLCVALEEDLSSGEGEAEDETRDVFSRDADYRAGLAREKGRVRRLQDARLRSHWPRLQAALTDLDSLLAALPALEQALAGARTRRYRDLGQVIYRDEFLLIGGPGPNTYRGDLPPIVIDAGGDDLYDAPVAVTRGGLSLLVDLGGTDVYRSASGPCRAVGGLALLVDCSGNDLYRATHHSLGSAAGGIAVLLDRAGDDTYRAGQASLGAGDLGWGLLLDEGGQDRYTCDSSGQGYAGSGGVGLLLDREGGDSYEVAPVELDFIRYTDHYLSLSQGFSIGSAPDLSGGLGLLLDLQGADRYACDVYGQGAAYWYGLGALVDRSGPDVYTSWQYAQGAGIHRAVGVLLDAQGSDSYRSHGVAQGCGHDQGLGWLEDRQGEDYYLSEGLSQAAGSNNGAGVLLDHEGNDLYAVRIPGNSQGYGNPRNQTGSLGLFADGAGTDFVQEAEPAPPVWNRGIGGLGADLDSPVTRNPTPSPEAVVDSSAKALDPLFDSLDTVDRLHVWAIWSTRARHLWQEEGRIARRRLHQRRDEYFPWLARRLPVAEGFEKHGIKETLATFDSDLLPFASAILDTAGVATRATLLWMLSESPVVAPVSWFRAHWPRLGVKEAPARRLCLVNMARSARAGLLDSGEEDSLRALVIHALGDPDPRVRVGAAWSLGQLPGESASQRALAALLDDPVLQVRQSVIQSLQADSGLVADVLEQWLDEHSGPDPGEIRVRRRLVQLLATRDRERALARIGRDPALEPERALLPGEQLP